MVRWQTNEELQRTRKEAVVTNTRFYPGVSQEGPKKNPKNTNQDSLCTASDQNRAHEYEDTATYKHLPTAHRHIPKYKNLQCFNTQVFILETILNSAKKIIFVYYLRLSQWLLLSSMPLWCDTVWSGRNLLRFLLSACFLLVVCLAAHFSTPKMEAIHSSDSSLNFYRTTRRHIPYSHGIWFLILFRILIDQGNYILLWNCVSDT
jgi:hypothetical protein